jgi:formylglycine-generating enzyme required for sulfatase activity
LKRTLSAFLFLVSFLACQQNITDMVLIPPGEFTLGISSDKNAPRFMSERTASKNAQPQQKYYLDSFYIDRYEVTYEDFMRFKPLAKYKTLKSNEPIRGISWYEADAYCLWIGKRLPTEFEWERAARGDNNFLFVWGQEFHDDWANFGKTVSPVGSFEKDVSRDGVYDMNGNVSEWTSSWYLPYPNSTHKDENFGDKYKVTRGAGIQKREHGFMKEFTTLTYRNFIPPSGRFWDTGFRCALSATKNP